MDHNLAQRRRGLEEKIPDIKKTLAMVESLQERRVSGVSLVPSGTRTLIFSGHRKGNLPSRAKRPLTMMFWMTTPTRANHSRLHLS